MIRYVLVILSVLILKSCVVSRSGHLMNINQNPNAVTTDLAVGRAVNYAYFGISDDLELLYLNAKAAMMNNRPLNDGEIYTNVTVDYSVKNYFFIVVQRKAIVTADVAKVSPKKDVKPTSKTWNINSFATLSNQYVGLIPKSYNKETNLSESNYFVFKIEDFDTVSIASNPDAKSVLILKNLPEIGYVVSKRVKTDIAMFTRNPNEVYGHKVGDHLSIGDLDLSESVVVASSKSNGLIVANEDAVYWIVSSSDWKYMIHLR